MAPTQHHRLGWLFPIAGLALGLAAPPPSAASRARTSAVPRLEHVVVVVMENKAYDQVRTQPYTLDSLIRRGSSFSNSYAITHPSQPNYLNLWAGSALGVTDNSCPAYGSPFGAENLGHACEAAGLRWRAYSENLPATGSPACFSSEGSGLYTRKHEPWTQFSNLDHANERVYSDLAIDIANDSLPDLAFVVPNNCHNTHDCSVPTGDAWLSDNVPAMLEVVGPLGVVIVTWDEDDYSGDNHILTVFRGAPVDTDYVSPRVINHHTLLRTIGDALGLVPFGGAAAESAITDIWVPQDPIAVPRPRAPRFALGAPYPNPGRGAVRARLGVPEPRWVEAAIHDAAGRRVRHLVSGLHAGEATLEWDGRGGDGRALRAGVYWLRVRSSGHVQERKIVRLE